jgi:hypothetical protein
MNLETRYADGRQAALAWLKIAFPAPTHPVVQQSATLQAQSSKPLSQQAQDRLQAPTTPFSVSQRFDASEQMHTRSEPMRKLSSGDMCTSCRKDRHYGTCARPIPIKRADFNNGMNGSDPSGGNNPSTSPHYHSATTSDSALARSRDSPPADEQAGTYFADLYRANGGGMNGMANEPGRMTGGLNKVALSALERIPRNSARWALLDKMYDVSQLLPKAAGWQLWGTDGHSSHEDRGPTNPYEERLTRKSPTTGFGDEGAQRIRRAFDQVDGAVDTTSIGGGFGEPTGGPAALG